jgi:hypothetical protein
MLITSFIDIEWITTSQKNSKTEMNVAWKKETAKV